MPIVSEIVQSGLTLADGKVGQYVEKAREYERIDTLLQLVTQHGPDVVKKLDEKVEQVLGGITDGKAKAVDKYNGAVEFAQQTKGNAVDFVQQKKSTAVEFAQQTKGNAVDFVHQKKSTVVDFVHQKKSTVVDFVHQKQSTVVERVQKKQSTVVDFVQQKKSTVVDFVQQKKSTVVERVQKNKGEVLDFVQQKTGAVQALAQQHLDETAVLVQQRYPGASALLTKQAAQLKAQVALLTSLVATQCRSVTALPLSLKERVEKSMPELTQRCSASLVVAKCWASQRLERLQTLTPVESAKAWAKLVASRPEVSRVQAQASEVRSAAVARYAAAKLFAVATTEQLVGFARAQKEMLPSYRQRVGQAARGAEAWTRQRVASFRSHQD